MRRALAVLSLVTAVTFQSAAAQTSAKPWMTTFIYGVVPSAVASAAAQCRDGLATVSRGETPASVLASILTLGMFSPITIAVTCATPRARAPLTGPVAVTIDGLRNALANAADATLKSHRPVLVRYIAGWTADNASGDANSASIASIVNGREM